MGDVGIDKWCSIMEEHIRNGQHTINPEDFQRTISQGKLFFQEQRISYWEKHRRMPTLTEILTWREEAQT